MDQGAMDIPGDREARATEQQPGRDSRPIEGAQEDRDSSPDQDVVLAELRALEEHRAALQEQYQSFDPRVTVETIGFVDSKNLQTPEANDVLRQIEETERRLDVVVNKHFAELLKKPDPDGKIRAEIVSLLVDMAKKTNFFDVDQRAMKTGRPDIIDGWHDAWEMLLKGIEDRKTLGMTNEERP